MPLISMTNNMSGITRTSALYANALPCAGRRYKQSAKRQLELSASGDHRAAASCMLSFLARSPQLSQQLAVTVGINAPRLVCQTRSNPTRLSSWPTLFEKTWQLECVNISLETRRPMRPACSIASLSAQISSAFFGSLLILGCDGHNEHGPTAAQLNLPLT